MKMIMTVEEGLEGLEHNAIDLINHYRNTMMSDIGYGIGNLSAWDIYDNNGNPFNIVIYHTPKSIICKIQRTIKLDNYAQIDNKE